MLIKSFARCRGNFPDDGSVKGTTGKNFSAFLQSRFETSGVPILQVEDSQIEHSFRCAVSQRQFWVSVSYADDEDEKEPWWEVEFHWNKGSLTEAFRWYPKKESRQMAEILDRALKSSSKISSVRWYSDPLGEPGEDYSLAPDSSEDRSSPSAAKGNQKGIKNFKRITLIYSMKVFPFAFIFCVIAFALNVAIYQGSPTGEMIRVLLGKLVGFVMALWLGLNGFGIVWGIVSGLVKNKKKPTILGIFFVLAFLTTGLVFLYGFGNIIFSFLKK